MKVFKQQSICKKCFFLLCALLLAKNADAQTLHAAFITENIQLDGVLDEAAWQKAEVTDAFWQFIPQDSVFATHGTEVRVVYDEQTLYVAIKAFAPHSNYVVASLRRDFGGTTNDNVSVLFDTFNDGTNAYGFGVTPYGVQREFLVAAGGATANDFNLTWDVKWRAESKIYDNYYIVEMAIPLTSLKFQEGATKWRFRPYRWNLQTNEQTTWVRVPQTQVLANLAFMGELIFEKPLGKSRMPLALIPYISAAAQREYDPNNTNYNSSIGGDAKVSIGDGMNLDLTFNPDFSNTEADDVLTNLTRFELVLPEKRQFFIDNNDLFASFGNYFNEAKPFFSRRIGLATDTSDNLIQNKIIAGARLSGKLNKDWRLGFLNIQTAADENNEIGANNNAMLALQRKVAKRSNIGVFLVNRQTIGTYNFVSENEKYNRVIGADYNLASANNTWTGRFYAHKSLQPDDKKGNFSAQGTLSYNANNLVIISDLVYVDNDFQADLGFVPRRDIFKAGNYIQRFFYPKNRTLLNRYNASFLLINYWQPSANYKMTDYLFTINLQAEFKNQSNLTANYRRDFIYLTEPFDPTRTEGATPLPSAKNYYFDYFTMSYTSNNTQLLTLQTNLTAGEFYNGTRYALGGTLAYRFQPWAQFGCGFNLDAIRLPDPYPSANILLLTPRIDITFNKKLFWTTLIQYSNQWQTLGINSRLQWRFAPLSDLFLVYNEGYYTGTSIEPRFRSLNLKFTYWLNL